MRDKLAAEKGSKLLAIVHQSSNGKCARSAVDLEVVYFSGIASVGLGGKRDTTTSFSTIAAPSSSTKLSLDNLVFPAVLPIGKLCRPHQHQQFHH